jgi:hypothetical protein
MNVGTMAAVPCSESCLTTADGKYVILEQYKLIYNGFHVHFLKADTV